MKSEIIFRDNLVQSKKVKKLEWQKEREGNKVRQILKPIIKISGMTNQWYDYYSKHDTKWLCPLIKAANTTASSRVALVLMACSVSYRVMMNHGSGETI